MIHSVGHFCLKSRDEVVNSRSPSSSRALKWFPQDPEDESDLGSVLGNPQSDGGD